MISFRSCFVAGVGHVLHHVDLPGRLGPGALVVGQLGVVEAEAVVVLDQEDHVLHAGVLGDLDPLLGVELVRLPLLVEVVVDVDRRGPLPPRTPGRRPQAGAPRDQPISLPVRLTGPQQRNMPNRMSCQASTTSGLALRWSFPGAGVAVPRSSMKAASPVNTCRVLPLMAAICFSGPGCDAVIGSIYDHL